MDKYFVTIFGIGYSRFAPGTLGSSCGVLFFFYFYNYFSKNPSFLLSFIIFTIIIGWYFTFTYVYKNKTHDPSEIIIDEFIGQLISLFPLLFIINLKTAQNKFFLLLLISFLLFRVFDILKPWPINIIDRSKNSLSILLDDIIAGLFSAFILIMYLLWFQNKNLIFTN